MKKVDLDIERETNQWALETKAPRMVIRSMLPFAQSRRGYYVHRIRSAWVNQESAVLSPGKPMSTVLSFWCGQSSFLPRKAVLFAEPPSGSELCATCEGRWIGAGGDNRKINGRDVIYKPRERT